MRVKVCSFCCLNAAKVENVKFCAIEYVTRKDWFSSSEAQHKLQINPFSEIKVV